KEICDILMDADFLSTAQYIEWQNKINKLKPADPAVNEELIYNAPYQEFNPLEHQNETAVSTRELKQELERIEGEWENAMREILDDPMVKRKMDLLDEQTTDLLQNFKSGSIDLTKSNALIIKNAITDLHQGLEKMELTTEGLKQAFSKPLTPDEAIEAFKNYIDNYSKGKERDKIRIILK